MDIAQQLSSLVMQAEIPPRFVTSLSTTICGARRNESYKFIKTASPLGLNRVVFITTRSSASASEVVINSLRPYVDVTIVGDTTHGKPAGMNIWGYPFPSNSDPNPDYKYVFAPITFEYVNASDEGRFYDGMVPDVKAADDITHDFGDPQELPLPPPLPFFRAPSRRAASRSGETASILKAINCHPISFLVRRNSSRSEEPGR